VLVWGAVTLKVTVEMTLTADTAQRLKETAERLAGMNLGDDGLLAAAILMRIATNYERACQASVKLSPETGGAQEQRR
jgi:vacuolar-type H+-ATPase catalytic subunit A/Vma1